MQACFWVLLGALFVATACGNGFPESEIGEGGAGGEAGAEAARAGSSSGIGGSLGPGNSYDTVQVGASQSHTCARLTDGRVKCWGLNPGALGIGDGTARGDQPGQMGANLPAVDLGKGMRVRQVSVVHGGTCALLENGSVKCWGNCAVGQCGLGSTDTMGLVPEDMGDNLPPLELPELGPIKSLHSGAYSQCALFESGQVVCWGGNEFGELGQGDTNDRGDEPDEMGSALFPIELGKGRTVLELQGGSCHFCALLDNHQIKCWGGNLVGQLGLGDLDARGDEPGEMGDNLPAVDLGTGVLARSIAVGEEHSCAILEDRSVKCWGANSEGQLGLGDPSVSQTGDAPWNMGDNLPSVPLGGSFEAAQLTLGFGHGCALSTLGEVRCWGNNGAGQLGIGTAEPATEGEAPAPTELGEGWVVELEAGYTWTCASFAEGGVKCWGFSAVGALGSGELEILGDEPSEMGDALPFVELE